MTAGDELAVLRLLDDVLGLGGRALHFSPDTPLLGALPELDSMAVIGILSALEERFGIAIEDDEIEAGIFASVATLNAFVRAKLAA